VGELVMLEPRAENLCFGCGGGNDGGMRLTFGEDGERKRIRGRFTLGARYQGGGGMAHGGIIALLLDEVMGKVCKFSEVRAVTAEMEVKFLKPVPVDAEIIVEGWQEEAKGRNLFLVAEIRNGEGGVLARGRGRFVAVAPREAKAE
jgi:uncharacterized protein (TIGR00369 family)